MYYRDISFYWLDGKLSTTYYLEAGEGVNRMALRRLHVYVYIKIRFYTLMDRLKDTFSTT